MINDDLDKLYKYYYKNECSNIIRCGVIDESIYSSVKPKILFILKEANSPEGGNWSIPHELNKTISDYYSIGISLLASFMISWRLVGVWAYSIIYGFNTYSLLKDDKYVAKGLQAVAMTNLKKTGGNAGSSWSKISRHASSDFNLWKQEIGIINPDLIICGHTYDLVQTNLGLPKCELVSIAGKPYYYSVHDNNGKQIPIIDFWHPNIKNSTTYCISSRQDTLDHLQKITCELKLKKLL